MDVPDLPGLGVEIDEAALAARHEEFLRMKVDNRARLVERVDPAAKGRPGAWTDDQAGGVPSSSKAEKVITNFPNYSTPRW
jgi:hypothetical protein